MLWIVKAHGREGGGNPLRQGIIDRPLGGKAAVAIAGAAPEKLYVAIVAEGRP